MAMNGQARLLQLDPAVFEGGFNKKSFIIRHHLADHALFALPRLIELSQKLPSSQVEYNAGDIPLSQDPTKTPQNGLTIQETIERIENCRSWLVLKNVEVDQTYQALLDDCLKEVRELSEPKYPGMCHAEGFIFISSPNSVTPFHIDPEHNFLLQIRGTKKVCMWDKDDHVVLPVKQLEAFYSGAHRNLEYRDEFEARGTITELKPGEGLHFPVTAPHWVKNGPEVSISFSITFRTAYSERRSRIHRANNRLRSWGLNPRPYGEYLFLDDAKDLAFRLVRKMKGIFGSTASERSY